jgi:hypothetical protein
VPEDKEFSHLGNLLKGDDEPLEYTLKRKRQECTLKLEISALSIAILKKNKEALKLLMAPELLNIYKSRDIIDACYMCAHEGFNDGLVLMKKAFRYAFSAQSLSH